MNVKEIIEEWLKKNGYDGLWYTNCGCFVKDLMACNSFSAHCQGGYKVQVGDEWEIHPEKCNGKAEMPGESEDERT